MRFVSFFLFLNEKRIRWIGILAGNGLGLGEEERESEDRRRCREADC